MIPLSGRLSSVVRPGSVSSSTGIPDSTFASFVPCAITTAETLSSRPSDLCPGLTLRAPEAMKLYHCLLLRPSDIWHITSTQKLPPSSSATR